MIREDDDAFFVVPGDCVLSRNQISISRKADLNENDQVIALYIDRSKTLMRKQPGIVVATSYVGSDEKDAVGALYVLWPDGVGWTWSTNSDIEFGFKLGET